VPVGLPECFGADVHRCELNDYHVAFVGINVPFGMCGLTETNRRIKKEKQAALPRVALRFFSIARRPKVNAGERCPRKID
jgi:hypothetical protein